MTDLRQLSTRVAPASLTGGAAGPSLHGTRGDPAAWVAQVEGLSKEYWLALSKLTGKSIEELKRLAANRAAAKRAIRSAFAQAAPTLPSGSVVTRHGNVYKPVAPDPARPRFKTWAELEAYHAERAATKHQARQLAEFVAAQPSDELRRAVECASWRACHLFGWAASQLPTVRFVGPSPIAPLGMVDPGEPATVFIRTDLDPDDAQVVFIHEATHLKTALDLGLDEFNAMTQAERDADEAKAHRAARAAYGPLSLKAEALRALVLAHRRLGGLSVNN